MGLDALIFDVDGTIADTEQVHLLAFHRAFAEHGLDWQWSAETYRTLLEVTGGKERMLHHIATLPLDAPQRRRLQDLVPTLHADKTRHYSALVADGALPLRVGVRRLFDEALAAGCKLAIASTTTAANIDALLQAAFGPRGLDMFSVIACGDQVRAKKPAPDIYQLALQALGLSADQAVAFEDSVHGLHSARAAGLCTVVTPTVWTAGGDFAPAWLVLPGLGDPGQPLPGEPGAQLQRCAWLTFAELQERHARAVGPPARVCA